MDQNHQFSLEDLKTAVTNVIPEFKAGISAFGQIWLEDLTLVWLDNQIANIINLEEIKHKLRTCIHNLKVYHDPDECINDISHLAPTSQKIIFIMSLSFSEYLIPLINDLPQLISIYIFSHVDQPKVIDFKQETFFSIDHLVRQLVLDTKRFVKQSYTSTLVYKHEKTFQQLTKKTDNVVFMWSKLLIQTLLKLPPAKYQARQDLLNQIRSQHPNESRYQDEIDQFERTYQSSDAVKWYTRDCFLYRILNQAFRTENIDLICQYRFFFTDLYHNIERLHSEQQDNLLKDVTIVYRGQCINIDEFNKLYQNIGTLIVMNNFLSTTWTREPALMYAGNGEQKPDYESVVYEIHLDNRLKAMQPFANIREFSNFPDEDEILFAMGTIFHLDSVHPEGNRWIIKFTLTDGKLPDTDDLIEYQNLSMKDATSARLASIGEILMQAGQFERAEKYFQLEILNKDAPPVTINSGTHLTEEEFANHLRNLIDPQSEEHTEYDNSSQFLIGGGSPSQQELLLKMEQARRLQYIGVTYNNLGLVNHYMQKFEKALSYYNRALVFYDKSIKLFHNNPYISNSDSIEIMSPNYYLSRTHNNIGLTYICIDAYSLAERNLKLALDWHKKAHRCEVKSEMLVDNLGMIYHNMGHLYSNVLEYDLAIKYFNLAIDIYSQARITDSHPTVSSAYHNLSDVYLRTNNIKSALTSVQKAYELSLNVLPPTHPDVRITHRLLLEIQSYNEDDENRLINPNEVSSTIFRLKQMHESIDCYHRGVKFLQNGDYDIALENLLCCDSFGLKTSELYLLIAEAYQKKALGPKAIVFYQKAIESSSDNVCIDECFCKMAMLYTAEKDYQNAIILHEKRLQMMINQLNHSELASVYKNIAILHGFMNNSKDELFNWGKSIHHSVRSGDNLLQAEIYLGIGATYYKNVNPDLSEKYFKKAESILETLSTPSPENLYLVYSKLGALNEHERMNNELAFYYYEKALYAATEDLKSTTHETIATASYNLALLNYKISNYDNAICCCQTARDFLLSALEKNDNTHHLLQEVYYTMAQIYTSNNDHQEAYETFRKLWATDIDRDHPAYLYLRSQFYDKNESIYIMHKVDKN